MLNYFSSLGSNPRHSAYLGNCIIFMAIVIIENGEYRNHQTNYKTETITSKGEYAFYCSETPTVITLTLNTQQSYLLFPL
jgi:hypothetical protein